MAAVWRVRDLQLDESVALKILDPTLAQDDDSVAMFKQEIKLARKIVHRNVCRIFDFGIFGESKFVTMELVAGRPLTEIVSGGPTVGLETRLEIVRDVLLGLRAAHNLGIVHRDIKPANVMVTEDGRGILMDFGIAGRSGGDGTSRKGFVIGTPGFMPPERLRGLPSDHRADLYAIGALLFELVAGHPPFEDPDLATLVRRHLSEPPPLLGRVVPGLPAGLEEVVARLLEKDPARRHGSVDELLEELSSIHEAAPRKTVLVVDDDPVFRKILRIKLQAAGFRVLVAGDGEEAIEGVLRARPDLVCLDLVMPKVDGLQVAEWLRRYRSATATPIFMFSGIKDQQYGRYAARLGIERFFVKPVPLRELVEAVVARLGDAVRGGGEEE
jgi:serine/threonine protein kinase